MTTQQVNILTGNHGSAVQVEDNLEYVRQGLESIGMRVCYSTLGYLTKGINIVLECSYGEFNHSISELRKRSPQSKLFVITTERLTSEGFNSANTAQTNTNEKKDAHYDNLEYWKKRTNEFMKMLPVIDGLVLNNEDSLIEYKKLGKPTHYLPLCSLGRNKHTAVQNNHLKDIDLLFTGTITPYREMLIKKFEARGVKVITTGSASPDYLRRHYFSRAKLSIGMNLSSDSELLSKYRAYFHLANRIPHVFERAKLNTDLDPYINFADPGDEFVESCLSLLSGRTNFPNELFDAFEIAPNLNYKTIFSELKTFLINTHNLSLMEAA